MKKIITIIFIIVIFSVLLFGCNQSVSDDIEITKDNYKEFFVINTVANIELPKLSKGSNGGVTLGYSTKSTIKITVEAKEEIVADSVVIKGIIDLPQEYWHRLHEQNELPIDVTINLDNNGHGEFEGKVVDILYFSNGYTEDDFYFECTSVSGKILKKNR